MPRRRQLDSRQQAPIPPNPWHPNVNWAMVHHRIEYSKQAAHEGRTKRRCDCRECKIYMRSVGLDTDGNDL